MTKKIIIKNINGILLLSLLLMLFSFTSSSLIFGQENFVFENFSIPQGLSNPTINCIYEDKYGFLWLGTNDGLSRYDGYEFKVYKNNPSDSLSLQGNTIFTISEDSTGSLWIGGNNVLAKYDRKNENFIRVNLFSEQSLNQLFINKIFIDKRNRIWIGTSFTGVYLLNPKTMTTQRKKFILKNEEITNGDIFSIIETSSKEILALDYGSGIFYYNEVDDEFQLHNDLGKNKLGGSLLVLHEDELDRLWIGGQESLIIYNRNNQKCENVELFSKPSTRYLSKGIFNILKDKAGFLWLATRDDGLYRYNPVENNYFHFTGSNKNKNSIKAEGIFSLLQDSFGNIWIGTRDAGLYKVDPNKQPMNVLKIPENLKTNSPRDRITAIAKSEKEGNIAIGTAGLGVLWQNIRSGKFKNYRFDQNSNSVSSNNIYTLTIDSENHLWIGSDAGLDQLNPMSGKVTNYFRDRVLFYGSFFINDLKFDNAGRLFIAHRGGVDILYPKQNIVKKIPSVVNRELKSELQSDIINLANSSQPIASILKVGDQELLEKEFEVTDSTKILIIGIGEGEPNSELMYDFGWLEDSDKNIIWGMHKYRNSFHFQGGMKNRIMVETLQLKKGTYKLKYQSDNGHFYGNFNVLSPKDSTLWGIQVIQISDNRFNDLSNRIKEDIDISSNMLLAHARSIFISKSYENILWIGTTNKGLFKYNLNNGEFTQYDKNRETVAFLVNNNDPYGILEDSKGIVWFSSPNGLGKLNPKTDEIKYFTEKDGLPTNLISAIQEDNFGNLWISSSAGLTTLVRSSEGKKETFINIDIKDGLQGYSYSKATWKTNNGEMFFGGNNGVNYFLPGRTNQTKPKIVLTDFKISDISVFSDIANSPLKNELNNTDELILDYSQNNIAFQFAPIHYSRPERNLIAYKLEGFNKDWVYSKLHFASFTNLEPGEYTFKLKAANGDGVWSDEEKSIHIEVLPPYWRTTLAYILYFVLFAGLIFVIDRIQRRRLLAKAKERMKIQEAEHRAEAAELQSRAIQAENERKTKELEGARQLQLSMLPKELPELPHLDIAVYMKTATEVGGDYYDFHIAMDGTLTVVLGDATGHGMKAGTMVTAAKSLFNSYASNNDILFTFQEMGRCIKQMHFQNLSMCMTMLKIENDNISMSSAGMPPIYIYRKDDDNVQEYQFEGMPLGTMTSFPYKIKECKLNSGDVILLLTDGLPELKNKMDEQFGYRKVKNTFLEISESEPDKIISKLKDAGSDWVSDQDPDDDVTFVVIKVK